MNTPQLKSLTIYKQEATDAEKWIHLQRTFDEKGNLLEEISYALENEIGERKSFSYDAAGLLLVEKCEFIEEEVTEITRYVYDDKGRIEKTHKSYGEQGDEDTTFYSYNELGKLVEKRSESSEGEMEHKETWSYTGDNLMEHIITNYDGTVLESSKFKYSDMSVLEEEIRYSSETEKELKILYDFIIPKTTPDSTVYNWEGKIVQRSRHTFDDQQRLVKEVTETVKSGVQKFTTEYEYDESANVKETRLVDKNENLISKTVYKHNTFNLPIEEIHFEAQLAGMEMKQSKTITDYEFY